MPRTRNKGAKLVSDLRTIGIVNNKPAKAPRITQVKPKNS
jgi:hypothetical protein